MTDALAHARQLNSWAEDEAPSLVLSSGPNSATQTAQELADSFRADASAFAGTEAEEQLNAIADALDQTALAALEQFSQNDMQEIARHSRAVANAIVALKGPIRTLPPALEGLASKCDSVTGS